MYLGSWSGCFALCFGEDTPCANKPGPTVCSLQPGPLKRLLHSPSKAWIWAWGSWVFNSEGAGGDRAPQKNWGLGPQ